MAEYWDDDEGRNPKFTTTEILVDFVDRLGGGCGAFDFPLKVWGVNRTRRLHFLRLKLES